MMELQLGAVEARFADLIWQNEPITSSALSDLSERELSWKKSTTYTVLKRLCDKGIFQNVKTVVTSRISREEFYARQSAQYVDKTFDGSLPAFFAAFTSRKKLSDKDLAELRRLLDTYDEEA